MYFLLWAVLQLDNAKPEVVHTLLELEAQGGGTDTCTDLYHCFKRCSRHCGSLKLGLTVLASKAGKVSQRSVREGKIRRVQQDSSAVQEDSRKDSSPKDSQILRRYGAVIMWANEYILFYARFLSHRHVF